MRTFVLVILAFAFGYAVRMYTYEPQKVTARVVKTLSGKTSPQDAQNGQFITEVAYTDGKFSPDSVRMGVGNYLSITNTSKSLMWLTSSYAKLSTVRGYGEGERLRVRLDIPGTYTVGNKLNATSSLTILVAE